MSYRDIPTKRVSRVCMRGGPDDKEVWPRLPLSSWTHLTPNVLKAPLSHRKHFYKPSLNPRWDALAWGANPSSRVALWCGGQGGKRVKVLYPADIAAGNRLAEHNYWKWQAARFSEPMLCACRASLRLADDRNYQDHCFIALLQNGKFAMIH